MKALVWLLVLFAAAVALTLASHNPGYVQFVYPPYRIEMSLPLFAVGMLLLFVLGYFVVRLAAAALRLPEYVRTFRAERAQHKGRAAMMESLTAFFEGRYAAAEKAAVRAMELGEPSGLNPIIAARAAHEQREFSKRDAYLASAADKHIGDATMRLMTQAELMLDQKQPKPALDSLRALSASGIRNHIGALSLELKAQQQSGNWDDVLNIVDQLEKRSAIDSTVAAQLRQQSWLEKLRSPELELDALRSLWKSIPADYRRRSKIAATAAQQFLRLNDKPNARQLLTDSLNAQWDSDLVRLYGDCGGTNTAGLIEQAEQWLNIHRDDAGLLLALGKLCLHQELWGKSQSYLDASNSLHPSRAAHLALAQLAERLQKTELAREHYQQAMQLEA